MSRTLAAFHIPAHTCPCCGKKVNRRREAQYCPYCGATLYTYRMKSGGKAYTIYVTDEPEIRSLAEYVADKIRLIPGLEEFRWTDKDHMLIQYGCAHLLLKMCEGSQRLAFAVVDVLFDKEKRNKARLFGYIPRSVGGIIAKENGDQLATAIAFAKQMINYRRNDLTENVQEGLF